MLCAVLLLCSLAGLAPASPALVPQGRVVGGEEASVADHPWQLSLQVSGAFVCGAELLSPDWVGTAAHCIMDEQTSTLSVRGGTSTRGQGGVVRQVSRAQAHPNYTIVTVDYDIALLKVSEPFTLGPELQPVVLPQEGYDPPDGLAVNVAGWGLNDDRRHPTTLQSANLTIVGRSTCAQQLRGFYPITERMVCASGTRKGACIGDSGGPLMAGSTLVGVVSWGTYDCRSQSSVYANVGNLRRWIRSVSGL